VTEGNPEVAEDGHLEDGEDPAGTEAVVSLEAEEDAAAASGANKPLNEIVLYIF
jgi:hypothetical protein